MSIVGRARRAFQKLARDPAGAFRQTRDWIDKRDFVQFGLRGAIARFRVHHRSGPRDIADDDPIVFCLLRNGMPWLASFLAHHRAVGFRHFVMLDNGSTDGTFEALMQEQGVTLLSTAAPYKAYENTLKRYLVDRYGMRRWCLFVDIDEQFDYPERDNVSLSELTDYLDAQNANCVITQMLDMFADAPLSQLTIRGTSDLQSVFPRYELANIDARSYPFGEAGDIAMHWGGIRKAIFGTDNGLTKVSFFRNEPGLEPFVQWHHVKNGRFADFSAVLFHYPFESGFEGKVREAVVSGRYGYHTTDEYRAYGARGDVSELRIASEAALTFGGIQKLIDEGFLTVSDRYRRFAKDRSTAATR